MFIKRFIVLLFVVALGLGACVPAPVSVSARFTCRSVTVDYTGDPGSILTDVYGIAVFLQGEDPTGTPIAVVTASAAPGPHRVTINLGQTYPSGTAFDVYFAYGPGISVLEASGTCRDDGGAGETVYVACEVGDGRVNGLDCAAPVAIFCTGENIDIYAINQEDGRGELAIRMPLSDVYSAVVAEGDNVTLAQSGNILLSYLSDGKFQINSFDAEGKPYVMTWVGCPPTEVETLES